ncbi:hypothetical protein DSI41_00255, partial [Mycobacterium tuberculosis]
MLSELTSVETMVAALTVPAFNVRVCGYGPVKLALCSPGVAVAKLRMLTVSGMVMSATGVSRPSTLAETRTRTLSEVSVAAL